ncbi:MAG: L-threonylcarbamoyladenylate synthase [Cyanobacteriota bacterium]|nr:L-threonylcarbamoyladenylate synthase [Cyanobacteriota bacterium]
MPFVDDASLIQGVLAGKVISFPTDTVPALAALPLHSGQIYPLKGRSAEKPLILMAADPKAFQPYLGGAEEERAQWRQIMAQVWPGAVTLVLPASAEVPPALNPRQDGTIGLRIPACPRALALLAQTGPLATTSANLSGAPPLRTLAEIAVVFPDVLVWALATVHHPLGSGQPSTVAQWQGRQWRVLRRGSEPFPPGDDLKL